MGSDNGNNDTHPLRDSTSFPAHTHTFLHFEPPLNRQHRLPRGSPVGCQLALEPRSGKTAPIIAKHTVARCSRNDRHTGNVYCGLHDFRKVLPCPSPCAPGTSAFLGDAPNVGSCSRTQASPHARTISRREPSPAAIATFSTTSARTIFPAPGGHARAARLRSRPSEIHHRPHYREPHPL